MTVPQTGMAGTVVVLGATGLVGSAIVDRLLLNNYSVVGVSRDVAAARLRKPAVDWRQRDIALLNDPSMWAEMLSGTYAVVHAAGSLQDGAGDNVRALQIDATRALHAYCETSGIELVQISAAGVDGGAGAAEFMRTKAEADANLKSRDFKWTILRPGMVLSPVSYGGSGMLRALAAMPIVQPIVFGDKIVRTVHVDDVADAVIACLSAGVEKRRIYDLVSDRQSFEDVVLALRAWLGFPHVPVVRLPPSLLKPVFGIGDLISRLGWRSPMRTASWQQIAGGVDGDPEPWSAVSGRAPEPVHSTLLRIPVGAQERWFARMWALKPVVFVTLVAFWLISGLIGLWRWQDALSVLDGATTPSIVAKTAVFGGSLADIAVAVLIAFRKTAKWGLLAAIGVSIGYLLGAALMTPVSIYV